MQKNVNIFLAHILYCLVQMLDIVQGKEIGQFNMKKNTVQSLFIYILNVADFQ